MRGGGRREHPAGGGCVWGGAGSTRQEVGCRVGPRQSRQAFVVGAKAQGGRK